MSGGGKSNSIGEHILVGIKYNFRRNRNVLAIDRSLANPVVFVVLVRFRRSCPFSSFLSFVVLVVLVVLVGFVGFVGFVAFASFWGEGGLFPPFSSRFPELPVVRQLGAVTLTQTAAMITAILIF